MASFWSLARISNLLLSSVWHRRRAPSPRSGSESNLYCPFGGIWQRKAGRTIRNHNVQIVERRARHCSFRVTEGGRSVVEHALGNPGTRRQTKTDGDKQARTCPTHLHVCWITRRKHLEETSAAVASASLLAARPVYSGNGGN